MGVTSASQCSQLTAKTALKFTFSLFLIEDYYYSRGGEVKYIADSGSLFVSVAGKPIIIVVEEYA
ncbi:hypothetical protein [Pantoea sp. ACRSB]|uniref:hypothetical protein n=1 Tax=Pantoea sp. ACRSB TaxID=2918207 RepID=UPI0028932914|nr:hypothetical protein [Pantoea sp. ACRSB]MCG7388274.1 hypothetical protein [Pantoea sp. ACRSB]